MLEFVHRIVECGGVGAAPSVQVFNRVCLWWRFLQALAVSVSRNNYKVLVCMNALSFFSLADLRRRI